MADGVSHAIRVAFTGKEREYFAMRRMTLGRENGIPPRWEIPVVWIPLILIWLGCIASSVVSLLGELEGLRAAEYAPGENLSACRDFALIDFSKPDPVRRAECDAIYDREMAALPHLRTAGQLRVLKYAGFIVGLLVGAIAGFRWCPRPMRPGWRTGLGAIALGVVLSVAYLAFALSGMPRLGAGPKVTPPRPGCPSTSRHASRAFSPRRGETGRG